ncbi:MAG: hypothetical protein LBF27_14005 [Sphingobacterium sp.]|jgi:hypothetical protein|nr:hypothetical protein [Sphingobacterium sp.]
MKTKIFAMLAVAVLGASAMYACKQSVDLLPQKAAFSFSKDDPGIVVSPIPTVANGWLNFPSIKIFNATMKTLHDNYENPEKLNDWERSFNKVGYTSLRTLYQQIDADTSETRRAPTVDSLINSNQLLDCPDSWFATVLSKDGYIQIADTLYSFKPGNENGEAYAIPARAAKEVLAGVEPLKIDGTKVHLTSFKRIPFPRWGELGDKYTGPAKLPICSMNSSSVGNFWGQVGEDIYAGDNGDTFPEHNGRTVKMNYHRWRVGYVFYASTGVRMKMWKHTRFAGWQSVTYADQMTMEACVKGIAVTAGSAPYPFTSYTSPSWPGFTRYAENNFEKTLKWVGSLIFSEIALEHFNFHWKLNYRGRIAERSIFQ